MADSISKKERSALMAKVRSKGNRSTEGKVEAALKSARIKGWKKTPERRSRLPGFLLSEVEARGVCGRLLLARLPEMRAAAVEQRGILDAEDKFKPAARQSHPQAAQKRRLPRHENLGA